MEDEMEGMEEVTEAIESAATTEEEVVAQEEAITEGVQESIKEADADAIKDTVREVLESEEKGYGQEEIEAMADTAYRRLTDTPEESDPNKIIQEKPSQPPKEVKGSEGTPKGYHDRPQKKARQEVPWPGGKNTAQLSERERLEAMRDGLTEFMEHNPSDYERERTEERLNEIEQKLEALAPDEPEEDNYEPRDISNEKAVEQGYENNEGRKKALKEDREEFWARQEFNKKTKTQFIKDMYSTGIGFEGLSEISEEYDQIIREASEPL